MSDLYVGATNEEQTKKICIHEGDPGVCEADGVVRKRCQYEFSGFCLQSNKGRSRARRKVGKRDKQFKEAIERGKGQRTIKPTLIERIKSVTSRGK